MDKRLLFQCNQDLTSNDQMTLSVKRPCTSLCMWRWPAPSTSVGEQSGWIRKMAETENVFFDTFFSAETPNLDDWHKRAGGMARKYVWNTHNLWTNAYFLIKSHARHWNKTPKPTRNPIRRCSCKSSLDLGLFGSTDVPGSASLLGLLAKIKV